MSDESDRPESTDVQEEHSANSGAGGEEGAKGSQKAEAQEQAGIPLSSLSEALGRKFESPEDAIKSLKNLNSLVGDQAIQDLKEKAKHAPLVDKLARKLADEKGLTREDALKQLQDEAEKVQGGVEDDEKYRELSQTVSDLKQKTEEKDLLESHPEAKHVLDQLKVNAKATGQSLAEAYESSGFQRLAEAAAMSEEKANRGTAVPPSGRQVIPKSKAEQARKRYEENPTSENADRLVEAELGAYL